MKHPIRNVRSYYSRRKHLDAYCFDMTPYFEEPGFHFSQTVGVNELPVIEPQASPEVIHEYREAGHDGEYTPWATELVAIIQCKNTEGSREEPSNIRVVLVEFFIPPLTLVGNSDDVFGRLSRPLAYGVCGDHGGWCSERKHTPTRSCHFI